MKLRKILSSVVAGSLAVSAMAISSSATLKVMPQNGHFFSGTGSWMPLLYSDGTKDVKDGKEATDYGLDLGAIGSVEVTLTPDDPEWFDGSFGGGIILSTAGTAHNWPSKNFWGVVDEELEIDTLNPDEPVQFVKTGDYTYTGTMIVDDSNCVLVDEAALVQLSIQEWGQNMCDMVVKSVVVKDKDGNEMISFDENGKASLPLLDASAPADDEAAETEAPEETTAAPEETEAPVDDADEDDAATDDTADDADADEDDADADDADADDAADEDDADADDEVPAETTAAPAETTAAPATSQAPAAGNVDAATDSSKGSPDTGVADVAAVAGLAIVAGGAVLVAKKRK